MNFRSTGLSQPIYRQIHVAARNDIIQTLLYDITLITQH